MAIFAGLADLLARLRRLAPPAELPVAIERPSGLLVETLVAARHPIVPIHPNAVKACRPRYRAAGGKSDPGDAYMLADILRTDGHRFAPLVPVAARVGFANKLRSLLEGFWPGAAAIFADIDSQIARAFLAQHRYSGRRTAEELLARLHAAPAGLAGDVEADAKGEIVRALVRSLDSLVTAIRQLSCRIEDAVAALRDGRIVMSFPRAGRICATAILAELGDVRERFQTDAQLAAEAGVSPVPHASGKSRGIVFRWACSHRLRAAVTCWADNSRHASPWAADLYRRARVRGCDHPPHAARALARA
jgi:transposase